jgi:hypothetical protein
VSPNKVVGADRVALFVLFSHMVKQRKRVLSKGRMLGAKVKTT